MTSRLRSLVAPAALIGLCAALLAGCGGGDTTTKTETETETETGATGGGATGGETLTIKMGDFFFDPKDASAKAGPTVIEAPNTGSVEHELVVFKTNMNPASLPTGPDGTVEEEKMDKLAESAGEVADVEAGDSKSGNFKLTPGKYVMFCNLPGHYAQGMYGTLTVTE